MQTVNSTFKMHSGPPLVQNMQYTVHYSHVWAKGTQGTDLNDLFQTVVGVRSRVNKEFVLVLNYLPVSDFTGGTEGQGIVT